MSTQPTIKKVTIYQARDGTEFRERKLCKEHEFMLDLASLIDNAIEGAEHEKESTDAAKAILAAYDVKRKAKPEEWTAEDQKDLEDTAVGAEYDNRPVPEKYEEQPVPAKSTAPENPSVKAWEEFAEPKKAEKAKEGK